MEIVRHYELTPKALQHSDDMELAAKKLGFADWLALLKEEERLQRDDVIGYASLMRELRRVLKRIGRTRQHKR